MAAMRFAALRRALGPVGAWILTTALAIVLSWLGVRAVLFAAIGDRPEPVSVAQLRDAGSGSITETVSPSPPASSKAAAPAPVASQTESLTQPVASPSSQPTQSPDKVSPSTKRRAAAPTPTSGQWDVVPDGKGGYAVRKSADSRGGSATFLFSRDGVKVLSTDPNGGYRVEDKTEDDLTASVTFQSSTHVSRIVARWDNRRGPIIEVTEGQTRR